ncbi:hypothetical protein HPG69_008441, partial [Diceros bicornis minor]
PGEEFFPVDEHGKVIADTVDLCATWELKFNIKQLFIQLFFLLTSLFHIHIAISYNPTLFFIGILQVESHPYLNQSKLLDFCKSKDIVLVAYSAFGTKRPKQWRDQSSLVLLDDPVLCAMAKKYQRAPALIALRYQLQHGVVVLAKSYNEKQIKENMQVMSEAVVKGFLNNFLHMCSSL